MYPNTAVNQCTRAYLRAYLYTRMSYTPYITTIVYYLISIYIYIYIYIYTESLFTK